MHITSAGFLLFLVGVLIFYYGLPKKLQKSVLLIASYVFYSFAGLRAVAALLGSTVCCYLVGYFLATEQAQLNRKKIKTGILAAGIGLHIVLLGITKYLPVYLGTRNWFAILGISFFTLQAIGYMMDVYRGTIEAERNPMRLALFFAFFPILTQGPIHRYKELCETLFAKHAFSFKKLTNGGIRILWGFFKKLVLADRVAIGLQTLLENPAQYTGGYVLVVMAFYALQLYADFTGGIDIALGCAELFGISLQENFLRPYFSKSVQEYWTRWHMSLGKWFTTYVFYPLSTSGWVTQLRKSAIAHGHRKLGKRIAVYVSAGTVWILTGLWHGPTASFVVWGLCNYAIIMISRELSGLYQMFHKRFPATEGGWYRGVQVVRTIGIMSTLRLFDCYKGVGITFAMFGSIFTQFSLRPYVDGSLLQLGLSGMDYGILFWGTLLLVWVSLLQRKGSVRMQLVELPYWIRFILVFGLFVVVLVCGKYGIGYDKTQFIYNI